MVRALLERLLNPEKLDRWFEATRQTQYTRDMLFSFIRRNDDVDDEVVFALIGFSDQGRKI